MARKRKRKRRSKPQEDHKPEALAQSRSGNWDRLAAPPRKVPISICLRLAIGQFGVGSGFAFVFGAIPTVLGVFFVSAFDGEITPLVIGGATALLGIGILSGIAFSLFARTQRYRIALRQGRPARARIAKIWDRSSGDYLTYSECVSKWEDFISGGFHDVGFLIRGQLKNWPVKLLVADEGGGTQEMDARMDLCRRLGNLHRDPNAEIILDSQGDGCLDHTEFPWLATSVDGHWRYNILGDGEKPATGRSLLRSLLVVVPTYTTAVLGISLFGREHALFEGTPGMPLVVLAGIVMLFTVTHGVVPVFFYRLFLGPLDGAIRQQGWNIGLFAAWAFVHLHMALWYGVPIIGLAAVTGWLSLIWIAGHITLAKPGRRRWVFLEYGSTSLALGLCLLMFSGNLFPAGIIVALGQALLLTVLDLKGRPLWIGETPQPSP